MRLIKKHLNSHGETLIELLIATVILGMTLTVIISAFMSSRSGVVSSWDRTEKNLAASYVMEQIKTAPYETMKAYKDSNWINISGTSISLDGEYSQFQIYFHVQAYKDFSEDKLLQVEVCVSSEVSDCNDSDGPFIKKASLIRKGDSSEDDEGSI